MTPLTQYLKQISKDVEAGIATEHTYRPALKTLIESLDKSITATNEPKRVDLGAPDFVLTHGQTPVGYIEAKDVGKSLDEIEKSEQLERYFGLGNLILTDYLEFRWYVFGGRRMTARLAEVGPNGKVRKLPDGEAQVGELLESYLKYEAVEPGNPKELAERMARIAKVIRPMVINCLQEEDENGTLHKLMQGFRQVLLHELDDEQFADMYTQTLCYGLFAARCYHDDPQPFSRRQAPYDIPKTNPFLRDLFAHFAGLDIEDQPYVWAVDDLAHLLARTNMGSILTEFLKRTGQEDPVVHFYETFLAAYDPKMREARGVYYTPEPVVSYIVRSVDHILKTDFGLEDGLAHKGKVKMKDKDGEEREIHKVQILDPATGTGTFLFGVINQIYQYFESNKGMWHGYVRDHLLPRIFGFELLMAPYAVAHLKLGLRLKETGYDFKPDERLRVYLTNTLEEAFPVHESLFAREIAKEANAAAEVKKDLPIMVVLGNPPYSGHSANKGEWIAQLLRGMDIITNLPTGSYFEVDGKPLGEKNPKWLNDDYVKFIRFAQWRIEQTGYGVLAFITNHGYLDNPTFRGMRQSLMQTFDRIYIYDLHGSSKKKETTPDGGKDENVFDIQQGVAICFMIKEKAGKQEPAQVFHADLYGLRVEKYKSLAESSIDNTQWTQLAPQSELFLFISADTKLSKEYDLFIPINQLFPCNSVGIVTARDNLCIQYTESEVWNTVTHFASLPPEQARREFNLGQDVRDWKVELAQADVLRNGPDKNRVVPILYRPFDVRWTYYTGVSRGFHCMPRPEIMQHFLNQVKNQAFMIGRSGAVTGDAEWSIVGVTRWIVDLNFYRRGGEQVFPLYLYPSESKTTLFDEDEKTDSPGGRRPNLSPEFITDVENKIGMKFVSDGKGDLEKTFGPEDVFNYIYAVFHSPTYRTRYAEFLKIDFPRVPLTSNADLFRTLCTLGDKMVKLHLMESTGPNLPNYPVSLPPDDEKKDRVDKVRYTEPGQGAPEGRVWINDKQYFEGIPKEVWEFHIGGYQVCEKWLKDRKGRVLSYDDLEQYRKTAAALSETIRLMSEIDEAIDEHGGWPID